MSLPSGKSGFTLCTPIFFVTRVEFDVTIPASLVLEKSATKLTPERHVLTMRLQQKKRAILKNNTKLINATSKK